MMEFLGDFACFFILAVDSYPIVVIIDAKMKCALGRLLSF